MGLIPPGAHGVEAGLLATVVTTLDSGRPADRLARPEGVDLNPWDSPLPQVYRTLFKRVGTPCLWFSRLALDDLALDAILSDPLVRVFRVVADGRAVGFVELDNRQAGQCTVQFVGLEAEWTGRGLGRWLLGEALAHAWGSRVERVRVQTCTLDHPAALQTYLRAGFVAVAREVQIFPDPRLIGLLPRSAAPHVPLIRP